jgi:hypothetical protein
LCLSFTNPGERELRKREKKKKWWVSWGYLTLLSAVPSWQTDKQASSSFLILCQAVMHL